LLELWASGATFGPDLGPVLGGFSIAAENWHWNAWIMLWLSGPVFITMFFFYPEPSSANILLRRAKRLRKLTGNPNLKSQTEIDQQRMTTGTVTYEALVEPWKINTLDHGLYGTGLCIYYSFFESVPLVYPVIYGFNLGETGLTFLAIIIGLLVMVAFDCAFIICVGAEDSKTWTGRAGTKIAASYVCRR
jgi:DHA1 family multidrug resistance protein-like MFS transporter